MAYYGIGCVSVCCRIEREEMRGFIDNEMLVKTILEKELNKAELQNLEILFKETKRDILNSFLILTDSPELAHICRKMDIAVAAVLSDKEKIFSGILYAVTDMENVEEAYLEKIWRRCRGIPWEICETDRCLVRETTPEDMESFYEIYKDKSITAYMENLFEDREKEKEYIRDYIEKIYGFYGFGMWTVCFKETGEVIGRAGLSMREGFEEPELGYVIGKKWQRQGIATEVCREILCYGRKELGFERVRALMAPDNAASKRLCLRLGFQYEGELALEDGAYSYYSIRWKYSCL